MDFSFVLSLYWFSRPEVCELNLDISMIFSFAWLFSPVKGLFRQRQEDGCGRRGSSFVLSNCFTRDSFVWFTRQQTFAWFKCVKQIWKICKCLCFLLFLFPEASKILFRWICAQIVGKKLLEEEEKEIKFCHRHSAKACRRIS